MTIALEALLAQPLHWTIWECVVGAVVAVRVSLGDTAWTGWVLAAFRSCFDTTARVVLGSMLAATAILATASELGPIMSSGVFAAVADVTCAVGPEPATDHASWAPWAAALVGRPPSQAARHKLDLTWERPPLPAAGDIIVMAEGQPSEVSCIVTGTALLS